MYDRYKMRVVASLTTIPGRYSRLEDTVRSLRGQTLPPDRIYLAVPNRSKRLDREYPPLPPFLLENTTVVETDVDHGPIMKIYGALISEREGDTVIVTCDDDVVFPRDFIEKIVSKDEDAVVCGTGALLSRGIAFVSINSTVRPFHNWNWLTGGHVPEEGRKVDVIFGVAGVAYRRRFFPKDVSDLFSLSSRSDALFHNDDVVISGYLSKRGVERKVYRDIPPILHADGADGLSSDLPKMAMRMERSIREMRDMGYFEEMEPLRLSETACGRVLLFFLVCSLFALSVTLIYFSLESRTSR